MQSLDPAILPPGLQTLHAQDSKNPLKQENDMRSSSRNHCSQSTDPAIRRCVRNSLALVAVVTTAMSAQAQTTVTYSDSTFDNADWVPQSFARGSGGSMVGTQVGTGLGERGWGAMLGGLCRGCWGPVENLGLSVLPSLI